jgi:hypothetical protein
MQVQTQEDCRDEGMPHIKYRFGDKFTHNASDGRDSADIPIDMVDIHAYGLTRAACRSSLPELPRGAGEPAAQTARCRPAACCTAAGGLLWGVGCGELRAGRKKHLVAHISDETIAMKIHSEQTACQLLGVCIQRTPPQNVATVHHTCIQHVFTGPHQSPVAVRWEAALALPRAPQVVHPDPPQNLPKRHLRVAKASVISFEP